MMKGSESMQKLKETSKEQNGVGIFFTPIGKKPVCNATCAGCYFFEHFEPEQEAIEAAEALSLIKQLQEGKYKNIFPLSTEILLAKNFREIIKVTGTTYVNTNGKIIAKQGERILRELVDLGIEQIVITANIPEYHEDLGLTPKEDVEKAFQEIRAYNSAHSERQIRPVATITLTSKNFDKVYEMVQYAQTYYGPKIVKFISHIPISGHLSHISPTLEQLAVSIELINEMRRQYDPTSLYLERGGTIGSQGVSYEKMRTFCPAGDSVVVITSIKEGSPIRPCIYINDFEIGMIVDGQPSIDQGKLDTFKEIKREAIAAGYCPAHALTTERLNTRK